MYIFLFTKEVFLKCPSLDRDCLPLLAWCWKCNSSLSAFWTSIELVSVIGSSSKSFFTLSMNPSSTHLAGQPMIWSFVLFFSIDIEAIWTELILVVFQSTGIAKENWSIENVWMPSFSPLWCCKSSTIFTEVTKMRKQSCTFHNIGWRRSFHWVVQFWSHQNAWSTQCTWLNEVGDSVRYCHLVWGLFYEFFGSSFLNNFFRG